MYKAIQHCVDQDFTLHQTLEYVSKVTERSYLEITMTYHHIKERSTLINNIKRIIL